MKCAVKKPKTIYTQLPYIGCKMEINYDKEADALYIELRKGEFAKNKKIDDFTIIDLDKDGNVLGIEFLEVSKRIPKESLSQVNVKNLPVVAA